MKTTREFITTTMDGKDVKIVATYVSELTVSPFLVNYPNQPRNYISTSGSSMIAYVNGKRIKECRDPWFWQLIDSQGIKKIWGLPIGFSDAGKIDAYNAFLVDLMQEDAEVIAYRAEKQREEIAKEVERCKKIIEKCENGAMVETEEEANSRCEAWNNVVNEGGSGYVPTWYTRATYEAALAYVEQHCTQAEK